MQLWLNTRDLQLVFVDNNLFICDKTDTDNLWTTESV